MKKVFKKRIYITPDNDESYKKEDFDSLVEKKTKTLFEVFNPLDRKTVFFDDRQDAKEYLLKQSNLKKTSKNKTVIRWVYDNRIAFDNLKKFQEWVNSKIVSV